MSEGTQTVIVILLVVFSLSAFIWPLALGVHLELEGRKKRGEPPDYDERQKLARLRAGNHALYVLLGFLVLWLIVDQVGAFSWTGSMLDMVLCAMLLTWCVWASDCVWHDGFSSWKDKRKDANAAALTYCTSMLMFVNSFCSSHMTASWMPFIFACGNMAVLCVVVLYKSRRDKKAEAEEMP